MKPASHALTFHTLTQCQSMGEGGVDMAEQSSRERDDATTDDR